MEAILKFNLPEERDEFETAQKGIHYKCVIEAVDNYLRGKLKYGELPDPVREALQETRDKLWQEMNEE